MTLRLGILAAVLLSVISAGAAYFLVTTAPEQSGPAAPSASDAGGAPNAAANTQTATDPPTTDAAEGSIEGGIDALIAAAETDARCAMVGFDLPGEGQVLLRGHTSSAPAIPALVDDLSDLEGVAAVDAGEMTVFSGPVCEILRATRSAGLDQILPEQSRPGGPIATLALRGGDPLIFDIPIVPGLPHTFILYIDLAGNVLQLWDGSEDLSGSSSFRWGEETAIRGTVSPPFGMNAILVVATDTPLSLPDMVQWDGPTAFMETLQASLDETAPRKAAMYYLLVNTSPPPEPVEEERQDVNRSQDAAAPPQQPIVAQAPAEMRNPDEATGRSLSFGGPSEPTASDESADGVVSNDPMNETAANETESNQTSPHADPTDVAAEAIDTEISDGGMAAVNVLDPVQESTPGGEMGTPSNSTEVPAQTDVTEAAETTAPGTQQGPASIAAGAAPIAATAQPTASAPAPPDTIDRDRAEAPVSVTTTPSMAADSDDLGEGTETAEAKAPGTEQESAATADGAAPIAATALPNAAATVPLNAADREQTEAPTSVVQTPSMTADGDGLPQNVPSEGETAQPPTSTASLPASEPAGAQTVASPEDEADVEAASVTAPDTTTIAEAEEIAAEPLTPASQNADTPDAAIGALTADTPVQETEPDQLAMLQRPPTTVPPTDTLPADFRLPSRSAAFIANVREAVADPWTAGIGQVADRLRFVGGDAFTVALPPRRRDSTVRLSYVDVAGNLIHLNETAVPAGSTLAWGNPPGPTATVTAPFGNNFLVALAGDALPEAATTLDDYSQAIAASPANLALLIVPIETAAPPTAMVTSMVETPAPSDLRPTEDELISAGALLRGIECEALAPAGTGLPEPLATLVGQNLAGPAATLIEALAGVDGVVGLTPEGRIIIGDPQCIGPSRLADLIPSWDISAPPSASVLATAAHQGVFPFTGGDSFEIHMQGPQIPGYLYLQYYDLSGNVLHLIDGDPYPEGGDAIVWGRPPGPTATVTAPYGLNTVIAIVSGNPLFDEPRPSMEAASTYLDALTERIEAMGPLAPSPRIEWSYGFISTAAP